MCCKGTISLFILNWENVKKNKIGIVNNKNVISSVKFDILYSDMAVTSCMCVYISPINGNTPDLFPMAYPISSNQ